MPDQGRRYHIDVVPTTGGKLTFFMYIEDAERGNYPLDQWLIKEELDEEIIWRTLKVSLGNWKRTDPAELTSLSKFMLLLSMSPEYDRYLPAFVANLSPHHAKLFTSGRQLRARLLAYLGQQRASVHTHYTLPTVLNAMVVAYALPTTEDIWSDGLQLLDSADIGNESSTAPEAPSGQ
jgi:hypothetical protein